MMKFILIVCTLCLCTTATTYGQRWKFWGKKQPIYIIVSDSDRVVGVIDSLSKTVTQLSQRKGKNFTTKDSLNPINFTTIYVRQPSQNGHAASIDLPNRSTFHYIKPGSNIHLEFDRGYVKSLREREQLNIRVAAVIKRKDGTIKPLSASGLTEVIPIEKTSVDKYKAMTLATAEPQRKVLKEGSDTRDLASDTGESTTETGTGNDTSSDSISDEFKVVYKNSEDFTLSTEINLAFEDIGEDDVIVISVINTKANNIDYTFSLGFFDESWKVTPTGGFSFIKTFNNGDRNFHAGGSTGVAFQYHLKPSRCFWGKFFNPSFGPEINVLQDDDAKTIVGFGGFITSFMNTVKFGVGLNLNDGKNEPYLSIGLNFVEGISTITETANRAK